MVAQNATYTSPFCRDHYCRTAGCKEPSDNGLKYCATHRCEMDGCSKASCRAQARGEGSPYCKDHCCYAPGCMYSRENGRSYCSSHAICGKTKCPNLKNPNTDRFCSAHANSCIRPECRNERHEYGHWKNYISKYHTFWPDEWSSKWIVTAASKKTARAAAQSQNGFVNCMWPHAAWQSVPMPCQKTPLSIAVCILAKPKLALSPKSQILMYIVRTTMSASFKDVKRSVGDRSKLVMSTGAAPRAVLTRCAVSADASYTHEYADCPSGYTWEGQTSANDTIPRSEEYNPEQAVEVETFYEQQPLDNAIEVQNHYGG
ncbi:hypothetical protein Neosp_014746 [[Neocosmospora] mangrovei]